MTQYVSLKYTAVKNLNFNIETWRTVAILKIEKKLQYIVMMQACRTSAILDR